MVGLTPQGFAAKTFEQIRQDTETRLRARFGPSLDLSDESVLGSLVAIHAEQVAQVWELAEAVHASQDPDAASFTNLDALAALTGTNRRPARPSLVPLTLTGTPTTEVIEGSRAAMGVGAEFATLANATIAALPAWTGAAAYEVGDRVTNDGSAFQATVAGTSAASGGPSTVSVIEQDLNAIEDGTVIWRYLGEGTGAVDAPAAAVEDGPLVAVSGSITEIVTPVAGWQNVSNVQDAVVGADVETDEDLRIRRELELSGPGTTTRDAIRAQVLQVVGVESVTVFVNANPTTDPDGIPPHAVEVMVRGGDDQDIFDTLINGPAAGIATHGTEEGTAEDSEGTPHVVKFTRPEDVEIYIELTLVKDPSTYPTDGDEAVKLAIVDWGNMQRTGKDAVASGISAQAFRVPGVLDVTEVLLGLAPSPGTGDTIPISLRQLAVYDTSRIMVTSSDGVP